MVEEVILWCPIQAEPKPGSGERVTVAIACVGPGMVWVKPLAMARVCEFPDLTITLQSLDPLFKGLEAALRRHGKAALVGGARLSGTVVLGEVRRALPMEAERLLELAFHATALIASRKSFPSDAARAEVSRGRKDRRDHLAEPVDDHDKLADLRRAVRDAINVMKIVEEDDPKQKIYLRGMIIGEKTP